MVLSRAALRTLPNPMRTSQISQLRLFRSISSSSRTYSAKPSPITPLQLPLIRSAQPLPPPPKVRLTSAELARLHRLCALNPPEAGSSTEEMLIDELGSLLGLMEQVKAVDMDLPQGREEREAFIRDLLTDGIGEVVVDAGEKRRCSH